MCIPGHERYTKRVREWLRLEGKPLQSPNPTSLRKQCWLQHFAQHHIQSGFEYLHIYRLHNLSQQPVPLCGHLYSKKVSSCVQMEYLWFSFVCIASWANSAELQRLRNTDYWQVWLSHLHSYQLFTHVDKIPLFFLFSRLRSPHSLSLSSCERCSSPLSSLWLHQCWTEGKDPLADLLATLPSAAQDIGLLCHKCALLDRGQLIVHRTLRSFTAELFFSQLVPSTSWWMRL